MSLLEKMAPQIMAASYWHVSICCVRIVVGVLTIHMPACAIGAVPAVPLASLPSYPFVAQLDGTYQSTGYDKAPVQMFG
jgi:hypothetical protein